MEEERVHPQRGGHDCSVGTWKILYLEVQLSPLSPLGHRQQQDLSCSSAPSAPPCAALHCVTATVHLQPAVNLAASWELQEVPCAQAAACSLACRELSFHAPSGCPANIIRSMGKVQAEYFCPAKEGTVFSQIYHISLFSSKKKLSNVICSKLSGLLKIKLKVSDYKLRVAFVV